MKVRGFNRSNFKRKRWVINPNNLRVTRATKESNPLTNYNGQVTLSDVNTLIKHGDMAYIGGDTSTYEFDFALKVAGSVVECPMKIYRTAMSTLQPPTATITGDMNTGLAEVLNQTWVDNIKSQDGTVQTFSATSNGQIMQLLIELDLTPLCNAQYGGSNAALKSALKSIQCDVWAKGEGASGGSKVNGVTLETWSNGSVAWITAGTNSTSNIVNIKTAIDTPSAIGNRISPSNKLYLLIHATNPSDGTIPSSVSLDYLNITIQTQRTPDVVQPIPVTLPKYWGALVRVSPNWDKDTVNGDKRFISLRKDGSNFIDLYYSKTTSKFYIRRMKDGNGYDLTSNIQTFNKSQVYSFLIGKNSTGYFMYFLKNNSVVEKYFNTDTVNVDANTIYPLMIGVANIQQADSFLEHLSLFPIPSTGLTDAQAEYMLRGYSDSITRNGQELVVNGDFSAGGTGWTVKSGSNTWDFSNGKANLVSSDTTAKVLITPTYISVLPNSKYVLSADCTGTSAGIQINYYDSNNTFINYAFANFSPTSKTLEVTTPNNATQVKIELQAYKVDTFTFDNISLKYVKPSVPLEVPNPNLVDMSKFTLHPNAVRNGDVITLNATIGFQINILKLPCSPNNKYRLEGKTTASNGSATIQAIQYYNNIQIDNSARIINNVGANLGGTSVIAVGTNFIEFITKPNVNYIEVRTFSDIAGIFTFSNISLVRKD